MIVGILLAIFAAFLVLSGGGSSQFGELMTTHVESQIKHVVTDADQRKDALKELDVMKKDIKDLNKLIEEDQKAFVKLVTDYHSTPADFDQQLAKVSVSNKKQFDTLWSGRQAMLSHITSDEWATIIAGAQADVQKKKK